MHITHQITLSSSAWENFTDRLNRHDTVVQDKINSFFTQIQNDLCIRKEAEKTIVESSRIDEDSILAALLGSCTNTVGNLKGNEFTISLSSSLDINISCDFFNQLANMDCYSSRLIEPQQSSVYTTTPNDSNCPIAA